MNSSLNKAYFTIACEYVLSSKRRPTASSKRSDNAGIEKQFLSFTLPMKWVFRLGRKNLIVFLSTLIHGSWLHQSAPWHEGKAHGCPSTKDGLEVQNQTIKWQNTLRKMLVLSRFISVDEGGTWETGLVTEMHSKSHPLRSLVTTTEPLTYGRFVYERHLQRLGQRDLEIRPTWRLKRLNEIRY